MKLTTGYKKPIASSGTDALELSSNNSYLLLAGGGHKALSELVSPADLTTELSNYVTIGSNQTITGIKTFSLAINANITGNADTVDNMHASDFATAEHTHSYLPFEQEVSHVDMNTVKTTGFYYGYNMTNSATTSISSFIVAKYSGDWGTQIQLSSGISRAYIRYWREAGGVMESWKELAYTSDIPSSLPASDVYDWAKAATKPSYNFGEIGAGVATIGDGQNRLMFRTSNYWASGIYYSTAGNESMVFANKNPITSWIFANTDPTTYTDWGTLTPSLQIKNGRVTINKRIESNTDAAYNLDVNGSANATELYENGVKVSVKGHTHTTSEITNFPTIGNGALHLKVNGTELTPEGGIFTANKGDNSTINITVPTAESIEESTLNKLGDKIVFKNTFASELAKEMAEVMSLKNTEKRLIFKFANPSSSLECNPDILSVNYIKVDEYYRLNISGSFVLNGFNFHEQKLQDNYNPVLYSVISGTINNVELSAKKTGMLYFRLSDQQVSPNGAYGPVMFELSVFVESLSTDYNEGIYGELNITQFYS